MFLHEKEVVVAAKAMDAFRPGWYREINLKTLNFPSMTGCVIGQLYGSFVNILCMAMPDSVSRFVMDHRGAFCRRYGDMEAGNADLTEAWRAEINRRLNVDTVLQSIEREMTKP